MAAHPYTTLPAHCFWRDAVSAPSYDALDPVVRAKFKITPRHKVATAGSCFAQHISHALVERGFDYLITESAPPHVAEAELGYGVFTARYGNIHTSRQLLQLLLRAYGQFVPDELAWSDEDDRFFDPFRPRIQPGGFGGFEELEADRARHLACVRRAIETMDVLVFTLGLTETWLARADGAAFPLCPGVAGGEFDEAHYTFVNLTVADVAADLETAIWFIRSKNPGAKIVLTVSPAPLIATALDRSVLVSTTYSKSVLRVAAEQAADAHENVAYFPAYEIIAGPQARGRYYDDALQQVTAAGVDHCTRLFMRHYAETAGEDDAGRR